MIVQYISPTERSTLPTIPEIGIPNLLKSSPKPGMKTWRLPLGWLWNMLNFAVFLMTNGWKNHVEFIGVSVTRLGIATGNTMENGWTCPIGMDKSSTQMVILHLLNYQRIILENCFWKLNKIGGFALDPLEGNWIDLRLVSRTNFYWSALVSMTLIRPNFVEWCAKKRCHWYTSNGFSPCQGGHHISISPYVHQ